MIPTLTTLDAADPVKSTDLSRIQDNVKKTVDAIRACPLIDGLLIVGVSLAAGNNTVNTGLNRLATVVLLGPPSAASTIYEVRTSRSALSIVLNASIATTIDVWVA